MSITGILFFEWPVVMVLFFRGEGGVPVKTFLIQCTTAVALRNLMSCIPPGMITMLAPGGCLNE